LCSSSVAWLSKSIAPEQCCSPQESLPLRDAQAGTGLRYSSGVKHILLWIALLLFVAWVVVRLVVALTSVALNLLWIVAVVFFLIWVVKRFR
jgi:hypothetical protein